MGKKKDYVNNLQKLKEKQNLDSYIYKNWRMKYIFFIIITLSFFIYLFYSLK